MDLDFKPFADDRDYIDALELRNRAHPYHARTIEEARAADEGLPKDRHFSRFLARDASGTAVARASVSEEPSKEGRIFWVNVIFSDDTIAAHGGDKAWEFTETIAFENKATELITIEKATDVAVVSILEARGWECAQRNPESRLHVTSFDPSPFLDAFRTVADAGVDLFDASELARRDPNSWKQRYWRMIMDLVKDVPLPVAVDEMPYEEFAVFLEPPLFDPTTHWIAAKGDQLVGVSEIAMNQVNPHLGSTHLTAVDRDFRRKGIATALKVKAIESAKERGAEWIYTDNEENNPMYQLNLALGFEKAWDWQLMKKAIAS